jgi:hypothetical protein
MGCSLRTIPTCEYLFIVATKVAYARVTVAAFLQTMVGSISHLEGNQVKLGSFHF